MNRTLSYLISLFFPIGGLFYAFINWTQRYAKNVFWIFCSFTGLIFIYQPERAVLGTGADGGRYALDLIYMHNTIHSFSELWGTLYTGSSLDIYQPILTYFVSRVTDNAHWLFFVFATIYGFFYSRNIWFVFKNLPVRCLRLLWILIAYYILLCPIWNINGVRMWTALQVFVFGAMPFLVYKDNKKLVWCFLSLLIHFSFAIPLIVLLIYKLVAVKEKVNVYFVFYVVTLFINVADISFFRNILDNIPFLESRTSYLSEAYLEVVSERKNAFHVVLAENISYWVIQVLIVLVYFYYSRTKQIRNEVLTRLFTFSLLLYGCSNIISLIPGGSRFIILSQMFMLPLIIFVLIQLRSRMNVRKMMYVLLPLAFSVIFQIRVGMDYYGIMLVLGNFFTAPFITSDIPLIEFVKQSLL